MNKKIKLQLNPNPLIKTYTYHCFFQSIVSAGDKVNSIAAKLFIRDFEKSSWEQQKKNLKYKYDSKQQELTFFADKWNIGMNHCFWRKCRDNDTIEIDIRSQLFSGSWGAINIFVTSAGQKDMLNDEEYIYRFGNFCKEGLYVKYNRNIIQIHNQTLRKNRHLVIRKKDSICQAVLVDDDSELILHTGTINIEEKLRIGFEIKLNDNVFYEWLFSNYIELKMYPKSSELSLDFLFNNKKNWNTYQSNYFVDYNIVYRKWISDAHNTEAVLKFIKAGLDRGLYVEMFLNENYFDGSDAEGGKPHIHQNLVYGYDDELKIIHVLNETDGFPKELEMTYEDFLKEDNFSDKFDEIVFTHYNPDYFHYEIDCKYLIYIMQRYLDSSNIEMGLRHTTMSDGVLWGIAALEFMLTESGKKYLIQDIRISYLLHERAECMLQRLDYLYAKGILSEDEKTVISSKAEKAKNHIGVICSLVLIRKRKYKKGMEYDVTERVMKQFKQYIQCEKEYINTFIQILKMKTKKGME